MKGLSKVIIILSVGLITSLVLIFFVVNPALGQVTNLNTEVKQKKTQVAELDQQILAYKTAKSSLNKAARREDILEAIPVKETLVNAVKDLENGANQSQLSKQILQINEY